MLFHRIASLLILAVAFLILTPQTQAGEASFASRADRRIRDIQYVPDQVVRLHGWVGYHTDIEFESGESFVTLGGGDLDGLTYGAYSNHLVLKPRAPSVRTNLTVITDRRTYILDYFVTNGVPDPFADDLIYSLRFTYPPAPKPTAAETIAQDLAQGEETRTRNFDYWYCGSSELQPVAASDDGVHTRLRFAPGAEIPALFVRAEDGTESLLNFSVDHGDVVIHRTARRFLLRRGKTVGCVVNKAYSGSGERLETETISPSVKREIKEPRP